MASPSPSKTLRKLWRNPHFWINLALFAIITILHYAEQIGFHGTLPPSSHFGLTRHVLDRILYLVPIIYTGYVFGYTAGLVSCLLALLIMLPRAVAISPAPKDAILETIGVAIVGFLANLFLGKRAKEKNRLQATLAELQKLQEEVHYYVRSAKSVQKRLTTLNSISTVLTQSLESEEVLRRAVDMVMEVMEVEAALIFSVDEGEQELVLMTYEGLSDEFARAVDRTKLGEGFIGMVAKTGQAMVVKDTSHDPRMITPEAKKMKILTELIVPLTLKNQVVGVLCVAMRRPREFLPEEVALLTAIGNQIGIAMMNARLYEKERKIAQQLAASERNYRQIFENANDAIWVHDLQGNIIAANEATTKLTGYSVLELTHMNVRHFLSEPSLNLAGQIRRKLFLKEPVEQPYEQRLIRKDGTEAILMLTSNLIVEGGTPVGFQHVARDVTTEKRMQDNLRYYLSQITRAQEEERKRIARELHDDTAQALYALSRQMDNITRDNTQLLSENAGALKDLFPKINNTLKDMRQQVNNILEEVRRYSQDLRPPILDDLGLLPALQWLVDDLEKRCGVKATLLIIGEARRFTPDAELMLFRIVQEALRNVEKHAKASRVEVAVEFATKETKITISDNGRGFKPSPEASELVRAGQLGLAGMEERARLLNGNLKIDSRQGEGTTVVLKVPV